MRQIHINIIIAGILGIIGYIIVMNFPFFKKNKRHGGLLTLGMAMATIILALVLFVVKTTRSG